MTACLCVSARVHTVVFPNIFSVWNQAGFAKVNLHPLHWPRRESARAFFREIDPFFLTGDPVGFSEMLTWEIECRPAALMSTAVTLSPGLKARLAEAYRCPVIDWYSVTETGPIAYECPSGFMHQLAPDFYLEILDPDGDPAPSGQKGEIAFTGGRNPYLPLLRYRTGDFAVLETKPCPCGDPMPRLMALEGRMPVMFRAGDGSPVNQVDIGRVLRAYDFVQHEFVQKPDGSCRVGIRPAPGGFPDPDRIRNDLKPLFGSNVEIDVRIDPDLGNDLPGGKVIPYRLAP